MEPTWRRVIILCIFVLKSLQSSNVTKPSSVNGCYYGKEGTFFWSLTGDNLYLNITANIVEDDWVAIGFSDDIKMGNDDVVAVYKNISTQSFYAASLIDPEGYSSTVFQKTDSILSRSVSFKDGVVTANITKSLTLSYPFKTFNQDAFYLMFGRGKIRTDKLWKPLHRHDEDPPCSAEPVALFKSTPSCISVKDSHHEHDYTLIKLHGVLMILVWLNLTPLTVYIARYGKIFFEKSRPSLWFQVHKWGSLLSGFIVVLSIVLAYISLKKFEFELHQTIGLLVLILLVLHSLLALFRPAPETRFRRVWELAHRITALVLFVGSLFNIINGLYMFRASSVCYVMISLQLLVFGIILFILEKPEHVAKCANNTCSCLKTCPRIFYMMNTAGTTSRSDIVKYGLCTIASVGIIVSLVVVDALFSA